MVWEFLFQGLKPILRCYEWLLWQWYTKRNCLSFSVFDGRMTVHKVDAGISRELAAYRVHEPLATHLLQQILKPGMTAVDVGSNIGYYALLESRLVGPTGRVMAIEPVPQNAEMLRYNIQENERANVEIHNLAISDRNGTLPMYLSERSNWHSLLPTPSSRQCMVPVSTLDSFVANAGLDRVDFIRMDVEGYEIEIIKGMLQVLESYSPHLLIELHPDLSWVGCDEPTI